MEERQRHDAHARGAEQLEVALPEPLVQYLEAIKTVRDTEDRLKNLINDPGFKLSEDIEIITTAVPLVTPIMLDQFAEVRTALDQRSEIRSARLGIEQTRIQAQRAKNETLPQLDLSFNYEVQGIGGSADDSFDNVTTNRYRSYSVVLNFSYPIGNRGARAALRRERMLEQQAIVNLHRALDSVVAEVNESVRQLLFRYKQLPPQLDSVLAADANLRSLQARAEAITPPYLDSELGAVEQVANTRQTLLQVIIEYNLAIVQLENAKGTLLEYYNVAISDEPE